MVVVLCVCVVGGFLVGNGWNWRATSGAVRCWWGASGIRVLGTGCYKWPIGVVEAPMGDT